MRVTMNKPPLIARLTNELGYPLADADNFDALVKKLPFAVLFFTEDAKRFPETLDVAVILPELIKKFPELSPVVVDQGAEKALQGRYNFSIWPALVFLKEGRYLSAITKVQDWGVYCHEIPKILALEPRRDPGIGIPVVAGHVQASPCGH